MVEKKKRDVARNSMERIVSSNLNRRLKPRRKKIPSKMGAKSNGGGGRGKLTGTDSSQQGIGKFFFKLNGESNPHKTRKDRG